MPFATHPSAAGQGHLFAGLVGELLSAYGRPHAFLSRVRLTEPPVVPHLAVDNSMGSPPRSEQLAGLLGGRSPDDGHSVDRLPGWPSSPVGRTTGLERLTPGRMAAVSSRAREEDLARWMMVGMSGLGWPGDAAHGRWLEAEADRLLAFARAARDPRGGFAWLDREGRPDPAQPRPLWITCRMTHAYALGTLLGRPGSGHLADHGIAALRSAFADARHGGWFASLDSDGPADPTKSAYEHVFVVLAAASATVADRDGARELLRDALAVLDRWFWQEQTGLLVDRWDEPFRTLDGYRGVNANMHAVEALLAAYDATGERVWLDRALRITTRVVDGFARDSGWRIPEHFDERWRPLTEYNASEPADPFRPYGATIGHSFEWSRLALHVRAALGTDAPPWLLTGARMLFDTAVRDGWSVDGAEGFVYTVDWSGRPVVRQRMHWVAAEAVAAAAALLAATGDSAYAGWYRRWWDHIDAVFVDPAGGCWWHELDPDNRPASTVWSGKPDVYHALQATLVPRLPLAPGLARALRENRLDA